MQSARFNVHYFQINIEQNIKEIVWYFQLGQQILVWIWEVVGLSYYILSIEIARIPRFVFVLEETTKQIKERHGFVSKETIIT